MTPPNKLLALLQRYWGPTFALRSQQPAIVEALTQQQDVLALLPTGEGKSLCYQLAGLVLGGSTLVISPLIALMQDQVAALKQKGLAALHLQADGSASQRQRQLRAFLQKGGFVYLSPEMLRNPWVVELFSQLPPRLLVVDEAHCISQWGHDFRLAYRQIPHFVAHLPQRPVIGAFTATAPPDVAADIADNLGLQAPAIFKGIPLQPQIVLQVQRCWTPAGKMRCLKAALKPKTLIYAQTRQGCEELAAALQAVVPHVSYYHAGCSSQMREQLLYDYAHQPQSVMVATNAFGMGVDIPDIQRVIHWQWPGSLSAYVQEVGRAGRNRQGEASALVLWLWGEKPFSNRPLAPDVLAAVLKALQHSTSLPRLQQQFPVAATQLQQICSELEMRGQLRQEQHQLLYRPQRGDLQALLQQAKNLARRQQQAARQVQHFARWRGCRRLFLYQAFDVIPDFEHCGACDRCLAR